MGIDPMQHKKAKKATGTREIVLWGEMCPECLSASITKAIISILTETITQRHSGAFLD